jgi:hypothetical protein
LNTRVQTNAQAWNTHSNTRVAKNKQTNKQTHKHHQKLLIRHIELTLPDVLFRISDFRYVFSGEEPDSSVYRATFVYHGFRYVRVDNYPITNSRPNVTGLFMHSDVTPHGALSFDKVSDYPGAW